jgi:hypothetical protein
MGCACRGLAMRPSPLPCVYERRAGMATATLPRGYRRHEPEKTLLFEVVRRHLLTFLAEVRARSEDGRGLPWFVERDTARRSFRAFRRPELARSLCR